MECLDICAKSLTGKKKSMSEGMFSVSEKSLILLLYNWVLVEFCPICDLLVRTSDQVDIHVGI